MALKTCAGTSALLSWFQLKACFLFQSEMRYNSTFDINVILSLLTLWLQSGPTGEKICISFKMKRVLLYFIRYLIYYINYINKVVYPSFKHTDVDMVQQTQQVLWPDAPPWPGVWGVWEVTGPKSAPAFHFCAFLICASKFGIYINTGLHFSTEPCTVKPPRSDAIMQQSVT